MKGSDHILQRCRSGAIVQKPVGLYIYDSKNLAIAIWQPCLEVVLKVALPLESERARDKRHVAVLLL